MTTVRDRVAAEIEDLSHPGGPLDSASFRLPGIDDSGAASFDRVSIRQSIIDEYLDDEPADLRVGLAAVITAGPPGAGKSSLIAGDYPAASWRRIDADTVKDLILAREIAAGTFDRQLDIVLPDGYPVLPRELAGLVHRESVVIADTIRRRCLADSENVVIEGTLGWPPHGPRLLRELAAAGYEKVDIVEVEIPLAAALERAIDRWWTGRQSAQSGGDPYGGRFTPPAAITDKYTPTGESHCRVNAEATFDDPAAGLFDEIRLIVHDSDGTTAASRNGPAGRS